MAQVAAVRKEEGLERYSMPKEEWGTKRVCPTTGKRFYDLKRDPIVSPYTGEVVELDQGAKMRAIIADKAKAKQAEEGEETIELVEDDEAIESGSNVDDDTLEEDDDEVSLDEIADVAAEDVEN